MLGRTGGQYTGTGLRDLFGIGRSMPAVEQQLIRDRNLTGLRGVTEFRDWVAKHQKKIIVGGVGLIGLALYMKYTMTKNAIKKLGFVGRLIDKLPSPVRGKAKRLAVKGVRGATRAKKKAKKQVKKLAMKGMRGATRATKKATKYATKTAKKKAKAFISQMRSEGPEYAKYLMQQWIAAERERKAEARKSVSPFPR